MTKIVIVGTGNVAKHLYRAFDQQDNATVVQVLGRNKEALSYFKKTSNVTSDFTQAAEADIYFIAVKDDAVSQVAQNLSLTDKFLVHCSGSLSIEELPADNGKGVFYPLQSFSTNTDIDFKKIPICIEAKNKANHILLEKLACSISDKVFEVSSERRKSLHLAAVFVNNFTNHMYHIGHEICMEHQLPFEILLPLIQQTAKKIESISPYDSQTGPARRQDLDTLKLQGKMLKNQNYSEIYALLSKSIQNLYGD